MANIAFRNVDSISVSDDVTDILSRSGIFQQCTARDLKRIRLFTEDLPVGNKHFLFRSGDPCASIYVLADGLLKLTCPVGGANEAVVEFVNPFESICEDTVFTQSPFPLSAQALQPSRVLAVNMRSLLELMHERPPLAWKFAAAVSAKVRIVDRATGTFRHTQRGTESRGTAVGAIRESIESPQSETNRYGKNAGDFPGNALPIAGKVSAQRMDCEQRRSSHNSGPKRGLHSVLPQSDWPACDMKRPTAQDVLCITRFGSVEWVIRIRVLGAPTRNSPPIARRCNTAIGCEARAQRYPNRVIQSTSSY